MKKSLTIILFLAAALSAGAQDSYYAEMLSRNNYYGTARSMALGNAMTALGGDLGSVTINPAGSAVSNYGQLTISPGLSISSTSTSVSPYGNDSYSLSNVNNKTRLNMPNFGMTMVFLSGKDEGFKAMSVGVISNITDNYQRYSSGAMSNSCTSMCANLAAGAAGKDSDNLGGIFYAGYNAGLFGKSSLSGKYVGSNEILTLLGNHYVPGELSQNAVYNTYGTKHDLVVNVGFNYSDMFYFGFNLGLPSVRYTRYDGFSESAVNSELFPVYFSESGLTNFKSASTEYKLSTSASGVYGKFGVIFLPVNGLRLGASIQSPSLLTISEAWQYAASTTFANTAMNGSAHSSQGEYTYNLRTPYSASFGAAFTMPGIGLLSVDYELMDYSVMRYRDLDSDFASVNDGWYGTNLCNKYFMGLSHNVRAGVEVKLNPMFSLRGGYSLLTSPERWWTDESGNSVTADSFLDDNGDPRAIQLVQGHYYKSNTNTFSFGIGYSSNGSFFADLTARMTKYPESYYRPYYCDDYEAVDKNNQKYDVSSPSELINNRIWDVVLTMGWRF